jgi:uncharacterized protein YjcR
VEDERIESVRGDFADSPERDSAVDRGGSGWVTTKVAAEALGVNPRTIRAYIKRGEIEARSEGEGIQKTYSVSIDSVYALRDRRGPPRSNRTRIREEAAGAATGGIPAGEITGMLRDLTAELVERSASEAELRTRLELTAQAESTLREELARERERADRLEAELREARKPPPEPRAAPESASEPQSGTPTPLEAQEPVQRRSWLYRFFFGP